MSRPLWLFLRKHRHDALLNLPTFLVAPPIVRERIILNSIVSFPPRVALTSLPSLYVALQWEEVVKKPDIRQLKELQQRRLTTVTTRRAPQFVVPTWGRTPRANLWQSFIPQLLRVTLTRYLQTQGAWVGPNLVLAYGQILARAALILVYYTHAIGLRIM